MGAAPKAGLPVPPIDTILYFAWYNETGYRMTVKENVAVRPAGAGFRRYVNARLGPEQ